MITIKKLDQFSYEQQQSFGEQAYVSNAKYEVIRHSGINEIFFELKLKELSEPYVKIWQNIVTANNAFVKLVAQGNSFGAYEDDKLLGFVITEKRKWNNSLWIELIQIAEDRKYKGTGTSLLNSLEQHAVQNKFRLIELETQNTNVPAIRFYRKNGYEFAGLNLTLYDPGEVKDEVAIYMSKKLKVKSL